MTEEQNKAVARRFFEEVWNQRKKEDVIDEIFASTAGRGVVVRSHVGDWADASVQAPRQG